MRVDVLSRQCVLTDLLKSSGRTTRARICQANRRQNTRSRDLPELSRIQISKAFGCPNIALSCCSVRRSVSRTLQAANDAHLKIAGSMSQRSDALLGRFLALVSMNRSSIFCALLATRRVSQKAMDQRGNSLFFQSNPQPTSPFLP